ncbi:MAG TPA: YetF domain-containing protein [Rhizomicrobium sp.]|nr:YetF domain-containing protein [Rhizomicrobium sp.]
MNIFTIIFGAQNHISLPQEAARAVLIFGYGLLLLRLSGRRTFGQWSALDIVISVIVGSALGRAMTGSAPLPGTMAAAAVLVVLHVGLAHLVARSNRMSRWLEGVPVVLIDHGRIDHRTRMAHMISENDLAAALREKGVDGDVTLENVKLVKLETSGEISVIKRDPCKPDLK